MFQVRSLTHLPVSNTRSRVEVNISNDSDVENSDESVAFSVLIDHQTNASRGEVFSIALSRALDVLASQRTPSIVPKISREIDTGKSGWVHLPPDSADEDQDKT